MLARPVIVVDDIHAYRGGETEMAFFLAKVLDVFHENSQGVIIGATSDGDTALHLRTTCM